MQGKVIAVTGGFGVLGAAVGRMALARGAKVALIDRAPDAGDGAPSEALHVASADLTDPVSAKAAMDRIVSEYGGLDALVNVAGGFRWETFEDGELDTWDMLYAVNVKTAVVATKAALSHLLASKAGRVVNVGAAGAVKAGLGFAPYAASKAGVMRFTESLAEELKDRGVTVNAVLPSIIDTPTNRADMGDADAGKWVTPDELAEVVLFLTSSAASAVTGALIPVTGRV